VSVLATLDGLVNFVTWLKNIVLATARHTVRVLEENASASLPGLDWHVMKKCIVALSTCKTAQGTVCVKKKNTPPVSSNAVVN
jgi:hypothetical protein